MTLTNKTLTVCVNNFETTWRKQLVKRRIFGGEPDISTERFIDGTTSEYRARVIMSLGKPQSGLDFPENWLK